MDVDLRKRKGVDLRKKLVSHQVFSFCKNSYFGTVDGEFNFNKKQVRMNKKNIHKLLSKNLGQISFIGGTSNKTCVSLKEKIKYMGFSFDMDFTIGKTLGMLCF